MSAPETILLRDRLRQSGYSPIPVQGKRPVLKTWEQKIETNLGEIELWSKLYATAENTGILTRATPTLDADILNEDAARAIENLVREQFEEAAYVLTRIGRPPKRAFLFRTEEPFKKIVVNFIARNGGKEEKLEFLAEGQQVVVAGIHPDTHKPYVWHGGEPGAIAREDLPYIREAQARDLIERAADLLVADFGYVRVAERPRKSAPKNNSGAETSGGSADWQYLCDRIRAGEALHDSLRGLAAKLIASNMEPGAAVNLLRGLMEGSSAPRDERWRERFAEIPRLVDSAEQYRAQTDDTTPPPVVDAADWQGQPVPPRRWAVLDRAPLCNVTLASGAGAVGKSTLLLQLSAAHVTGKDWFGSMPIIGPVLYLSAEDDVDELHFRTAAIAGHLDVPLSALKGLHFLPLAGKDALLAIPDRAGIIRPTPLFASVHKIASDLHPVNIIIDTAADTFGGRENDRAQVRQFIGLLRGLAIDVTAGVVLVSHPSLTGLSTDTGLSGSTAWDASVRARWYFKPIHDDDTPASDPDLRELVIMKNNYGPPGEHIRMRWQNGLFVPIGTPSSLEKLAADQKAEHAFLDLLDRFASQNQRVGPYKGPLRAREVRRTPRRQAVRQQEAGRRDAAPA
jgi:RecA-family ATPase